MKIHPASVLASALFGVSALVLVFRFLPSTETEAAQPAAASLDWLVGRLPSVSFPDVEVRVHEVARGETAGGILQKYGVSGVRSLVSQAKPFIDLAKVRPGQELAFLMVEGHPQRLQLAINEDETFVAELEPLEMRVDRREYETRTRRVSLDIESSLWTAAKKEGLRAPQILAMSKVFENEVDFNLDLRAGDSMTVVGDALYDGDTFIRFSEIRAVELVNRGETYTGVYYSGSEKLTGWYAPDGESLDRAPVVKRPTRRFGAPFKRGQYRRYQKNLKRRPMRDGDIHMGGDFYQKRCGGRCRHSAIDLRAAQGTPLVAIGSGVVRAKTPASSLCGFGVQLAMKDRSGKEWRALYCHMSKIEVKVGQRVKKGQRIGLSGGTPGTYGAGNTTAPHLHLELRMVEGRKARLVDPLPHINWSPFRLKARYTKGHEPKAPPPLPPPNVTKTKEAAAFKEQRDGWLGLLREE